MTHADDLTAALARVERAAADVQNFQGSGPDDELPALAEAIDAIATALQLLMTTPAPPQLRTLADFRAVGYLDGYTQSDCVPGDRQIAQRATCPACGASPLRYRAYTSPASYIAFTICPLCGLAEEF